MSGGLRVDKRRRQGGEGQEAERQRGVQVDILTGDYIMRCTAILCYEKLYLHMNRSPS